MPISNPASMMQPSSKCICGFLVIFRASIYKIPVIRIRIPKNPIIQTGFSRKIRKNSSSDLVLLFIPYPIIGMPIKRELPITPMAIAVCSSIAVSMQIQSVHQFYFLYLVPFMQTPPTAIHLKLTGAADRTHRKTTCETVSCCRSFRCIQTE